MIYIIFAQDFVVKKKFNTILKKALIYAFFVLIIGIVIEHQPFKGVHLQPLINYLYSPHRSPPVPLSGYLTFYRKFILEKNYLYFKKRTIYGHPSRRESFFVIYIYSTRKIWRLQYDIIHLYSKSHVRI